MNLGATYLSDLHFLQGEGSSHRIHRWRGHPPRSVGACYVPLTDEDVKTSLTKVLARNAACE